MRFRQRRMRPILFTKYKNILKHMTLILRHLKCTTHEGPTLLTNWESKKTVIHLWNPIATQEQKKRKKPKKKTKMILSLPWIENFLSHTSRRHLSSISLYGLSSKWRLMVFTFVFHFISIYIAVNRLGLGSMEEWICANPLNMC